MTVAALILTVLAAAPMNNVFDQASAAYSKGDYAESAALYEKLVAEDVSSAEVFYNLGNAYYRLQRYGAALANYDRALGLDPTMENARFNAAQVRSETRRGLTRPLAPPWEQALLFWHLPLSPTTAVWLFLASNLLLWGTLFLRLWKPLRYSNVVVVVLAVFTVMTALSAWAKTHPEPVAYAAQEVVPVRYGPSNDDTARFELYDGDAVSVEATRGDWLRVRTIDGEQGWATVNDLALVGPPYGPSPPVRENTRDDG